MTDSVSCVTAAEFLEKRLDHLEYVDPVSGEVDIVRLVEFTHTSPHIMRTRRKIAHAVVATLERGGYTITKRANEDDDSHDAMRVTYCSCGQPWWHHDPFYCHPEEDECE